MIALSVLSDRCSDLGFVHAEVVAEGHREGWAEVTPHGRMIGGVNPLRLQGIVNAVEYPGAGVGQGSVEIE